MMEAIAVNLLATGVVEGGLEAKRRFVRHLKQQKYSDEVGPIATAFNKTLENELLTVAETAENDELKSIAQNWDLFAAELDSVDVLVESEAAAVDRIAAAIVDTEDVVLTETTEDELERAIIEAYRAAVQTFHEQIADTELGTLLRQELDLDIARGINASLTRLKDLDRQLGSIVEAELKDQGFDRLSLEYFDQRNPKNDPEVCWLSGFDLVDIQAGYTFERTYPNSTDDRQSVTSTLIEKLEDGNNLVITGHPGAGKSTICQQLAVHWFDYQYGTVLYRPEDTPNPFTTTGMIEEYLTETEDDVLVVIENAIGTVAAKTAALVKRFSADTGVSFLLEIPKTEWQTSITDSGVRDLKQMDFVDEESVPMIDEFEVERAIDHFKKTTGRDVLFSSQELLREVNMVTTIGGMYLLSYRLASPVLTSKQGGGKPESGLQTDVINTYTTVKDMSSDLSLEVGMMINLLNASGVGVYPELVHSLASDYDEYQDIDRILDQLDGRMLFDQSEPKFRAHHPFWSVLYLKHVIHSDRNATRRQAIHQLETCINALLALIDDESKRDQIRRWFRRNPPYFEKIAANPRKVADELIEYVFKLGRNYPVLAPLFGPSEFSRIAFPDACSQTSVFDTIIWRGQMYLARGEMENAAKEFTRLKKKATDAERLDANASVYYEAVSLYNLGLIGMKSRISTPSDPYECLDRSRELFDDLSDHADDKERFDEMYEDLFDHKSPGYHLTRFGQTGYSDAFTQSQKVLNEVHGMEAMMSQKMAAIVENRKKARRARQRGDWEAALEFLQKSREAFNDDHVDRFGEADVSELSSRDFLLVPETRFVQGEAIYLNDLGEIALERDQTDLETAENYFRRCLELSDEIGFPNGKAMGLDNLGEVERSRGNTEQACKYFYEAAENFKETEAVPDALSVIKKLLTECTDVDGAETDRDWCEEAFNLAGEAGLDEEYREFVDLCEQR